jgi:hypothetical protein
MKKFFLKFLAVFVLFSLFASLATFGWLRATDASASALPALKPGDIIFQTSRSNQSLAIMLASKSPYSHVGLIDFDKDGEPLVFEAVATVRDTPLQSWIDRGLGGRILILRDPRLDDSARTRLMQAARTHAGKPYDLFFHKDRESIYCSELVDFAYREAGLRPVGTYQSLASLDLDNFAAREVINRRWQKHPACADGKANSADACMSVLKTLSLITPDSIATDTALEVVWSNYPH